MAGGTYSTANSAPASSAAQWSSISSTASQDESSKRFAARAVAVSQVDEAPHAPREAPRPRRSPPRSHGERPRRLAVCAAAHAPRPANRRACASIGPSAPLRRRRPAADRAAARTAAATPLAAAAHGHRRGRLARRRRGPRPTGRRSTMAPSGAPCRASGTRSTTARRLSSVRLQHRQHHRAGHGRSRPRRRRRRASRVTPPASSATAPYSWRRNNSAAHLADPLRRNGPQDGP